MLQGLLEARQLLRARPHAPVQKINEMRLPGCEEDVVVQLQQVSSTASTSMPSSSCMLHLSPSPYLRIMMQGHGLCRCCRLPTPKLLVPLRPVLCLVQSC